MKGLFRRLFSKKPEEPMALPLPPLPRNSTMLRDANRDSVAELAVDRDELAIGSGPLVVAPPAMTCSPEQVASAVGRVLEHFHENQPGPESFPGAASRILSVVNEDQPDFGVVVRVVRQDLAVTAKLLQIANSALYGRSSEVQDLRAAIVKIGLLEVAQIAVGLAGRSLFEAGTRAEYAVFPHKWGELFHQSMTAALTASWLSIAARVSQPDHAFLAGLLYDIGKPVAMRSLAQLHLCGSVGEAVIHGGTDEVVQRAHVTVGAELAESWGLPEYLQAAIIRHHQPEVPAERSLAELHIVRVVGGIAALRDNAITEEQREILQASAQALGIDHRMIRAAANEHAELAMKVTDLFGVADPTMRTHSRSTPIAVS